MFSPAQALRNESVIHSSEIKQENANCFPLLIYIHWYTELHFTKTKSYIRADWNPIYFKSKTTARVFIHWIKNRQTNTDR